MSIDEHCDTDRGCQDERIRSLAETIRRFREHESDYTVTDYLSMTCHEEAVDLLCRTQMIQWIMGIIDHCGFHRVTVSIATNYLDRFLMTTELARQDRSAFQLGFITCLYIAIKIHEPTVLSIDSIQRLIRDAYTKEQIETMELLILNANQWRMNPSTPFHFALYLSEMIALMYPRLDLETVQELTNLQLEGVLNAYDVSLMPSSLVALAAILNAVDSMDVCSAEELQDMESKLHSLLQSDPSISFNDIRIRLYESISDDESHSPHLSAASHSTACGSAAQMSRSPRSVSAIRVVSP